MSGVAVGHLGPAVSAHGLRRAAHVAAVAIAAAALIVALLSTPGDVRTAVTPTRAHSATPEGALADWIEDALAELFPTFAGPYVGTCPAQSTPPLVVLCSRVFEDLGDHQIHIVGVDATDWGADVLLEETAAGWAVIDSSPWPEIGTAGHYGPPWSPIVAISEWWAEDDRAAARYGTGVVHLHQCADASPDIDQPLLCSTLVAGDGEERTYTSGLADEPPDLMLTLRRGTDHTWSVRRAEAKGTSR